MVESMQPNEAMMNDSELPEEPIAVAKAGDLAVAIMKAHLNHLQENEAGTIAGIDPEALHDMRVATRRLRAACRAFSNVFQPGVLEPYIEDIHWLAQLLGQVRDLDVFLLWLADYVQTVNAEEQPVVWAIASQYRQERETYRQELLTALVSERYELFKERFMAFLAEPQSAFRKRAALSGRAAGTKTIRRQFRFVRRRLKALKGKNLVQLHQLRIACKRLRYTCEFFQIFFPEDLQTVINDCVQVQDSLGNMRDAKLHAQLLLRQAKKTANDAERQTLCRMASVLRSQAKGQYSQFKKSQQKIAVKKYRKQLYTFLKDSCRETCADSIAK